MLYFVTGNPGKLAEIKSLLPEVEQLDIDLTEIQDIDARNIIREKLTEARRHQKGELLVEDTSLYLDCLNGFPGPLIKWLLGSIGQLVNGVVNGALNRRACGRAERVFDFHAPCRAQIDHVQRQCLGVSR